MEGIKLKNKKYFMLYNLLYVLWVRISKFIDIKRRLVKGSVMEKYYRKESKEWFLIEIGVFIGVVVMFIIKL